MKKLVTEGQVTSPKSLYKSVQRQEKKTGLSPYATMFKLLDLLQKGFKLILKSDFMTYCDKASKTPYSAS